MGLWSGNLDRFVIFVSVNIPPYTETLISFNSGSVGREVPVRSSVPVQMGTFALSRESFSQLVDSQKDLCATTSPIQTVACFFWVCLIRGSEILKSAVRPCTDRLDRD